MHERQRRLSRTDRATPDQQAHVSVVLGVTGARHPAIDGSAVRGGETGRVGARGHPRTRPGRSSPKVRRLLDVAPALGAPRSRLPAGRSGTGKRRSVAAAREERRDQLEERRPWPRSATEHHHLVSAHATVTPAGGMSGPVGPGKLASTTLTGRDTVICHLPYAHSPP